MALVLVLVVVLVIVIETVMIESEDEEEGEDELFIYQPSTPPTINCFLKLSPLITAKGASLSRTDTTRMFRAFLAIPKSTK